MRDHRVVSEILGSETVVNPSDVYSKQFRRALFGGYQPHDVDDYLHRLADIIESMIRTIRELKDDQESLKTQMEEYRQMEATLRSALVTSQRLGEDLVDSARREADSLREAGLAEHERLMNRAGRLPEQLKDEIRRLKDQRNRLRDDMLAVLETHRTLIERQVPPNEEITE
ncbi:MAG: DivIVA domain-containing protein [Candidatus Hydrogenedentes bacterium]|nr:DivIVA domain-containing protein [Candidatus Hydrogenedentota bacterium]